MLNEKIEKEKLERWRNGVERRPMTKEALANAVVYGFNQCPEHCVSRERSGRDACACIRSIFPSPEHYELYEILRDKLMLTELKTLSENGD